MFTHLSIFPVTQIDIFSVIREGFPFSFTSRLRNCLYNYLCGFCSDNFEKLQPSHYYCDTVIINNVIEKESSQERFLHDAFFFLFLHGNL